MIFSNVPAPGRDIAAVDEHEKGDGGVSSRHRDTVPAEGGVALQFPAGGGPHGELDVVGPRSLVGMDRVRA